MEIIGLTLALLGQGYTLFPLKSIAFITGETLATIGIKSLTQGISRIAEPCLDKVVGLALDTEQVVVFPGTVGIILDDFLVAVVVVAFL